jgi:purine-binding chemotaxis protein CheW
VSERLDAAALRAELERSFAAPLSTSVSQGEAILVVRVREHRHALRVVELAGLYHDLLVVDVPGPEPSFLGLVGLRGALVPVYDLGALLGHAPAAEPPAWLVIARGATPVALAFDGLEAHTSARPEGDVARAAAGVWPLLPVPRLLGELSRRLHPEGRT